MKKNYHLWFEVIIYSFCYINSKMDSIIIIGGVWKFIIITGATRQTNDFYIDQKGEENTFVTYKRNFKGKIRYKSHYWFSGGSSSHEKKKETSNHYGKNPLRYYQCGNIGHIKRYCPGKKRIIILKLKKLLKKKTKKCVS